MKVHSTTVVVPNHHKGYAFAECYLLYIVVLFLPSRRIAKYVSSAEKWVVVSPMMPVYNACNKTYN